MSDWNEFYRKLKNGQGVSSYLTRCRDLTCLRANDNHLLVIAADSLGGIGSKPFDVVQASPDVVGHFALRVPLMEVLAAGATPFLIVDNLSVEAGDYGEAILAGMKRLAETLGLADSIHFNGSTEDNVMTHQTGVGVTVIGLVSNADFQVGSSKPGDRLLVAGYPKSAPHHRVTVDDPDILELRQLRALRAQSQVADIVPVGSRGIRYEAEQLANAAGLQPYLDANAGAGALALETSGGPSTCVVFSWRGTDLAQLAGCVTAPLTPIGWLERE